MRRGVPNSSPILRSSEEHSRDYVTRRIAESGRSGGAAARPASTAQAPGAALTVFAWGNTARGDDGIGPILAERLREQDVPGLRVIEDHQLNIEHVTDLEECAAALFIDASLEIEEGCRLERIGPSSDGNFSTHAISPQALLNVYEQTMKVPAPDSWLLHVAAREFELGAEPGNTAKRSIEEAKRFLEELVEHEPSDWREQLARNGV